MNSKGYFGMDVNMQTSTFQEEVEKGERFKFGENWALFLRSLTEARIVGAETSLKQYLGVDTLEGKTFLDVGSGSGLFSLAARRMGAKVTSIDFDPQSVGCTTQLRKKFEFETESWVIEQGSALDPTLLSKYGQFDIVYSWGVLHHTGSMWQAIDNVQKLTKEGGKFFIAIYNDQGKRSKIWTKVKRTYCGLPGWAKFLVLWPSLVWIWWRPMLTDVIRLQPFKTWNAYGKGRGMTPWRDLVDWVGGYPFEVATVDQLFSYLQARGYDLFRLRSTTSLGCHEMVFKKTKASTLADK
jgi:2-polyprenyl-3-methyl-5-hydroxy-6-metoxy-1,4-benzoquinol methylase